MKKGIGVGLIVALVALSGCGAIGEAKKIKDVASGKTAKQIEDFQKRADKAKTLTYTVEYQGTSSNGSKSEKIFIAQKPPKSVYKQGDSTIIDDGSKTFVCSPDSSTNQTQCLESGPSGASPQGFVQALSVTGVFAGLTALAIVPGITVKNSSRNIAGEKVDCVSVESTRKNDKGKFESCVTSDGILAFTDNGDGDVFTMTSFKRSASDSDFKLPGKAVTTQDLLNQATSTTTSTTSTTEATTSTTTADDTSTTSTSEDTTSTTGG